MADGGYTILHRKDERGVIVESKVFGPDDEVPEGFGAAEYTPVYDVWEDDQAPVAESVLTPWESPIAKGSWVENRPEDAEVDEGTPVQARLEDERTGAEEEVEESLADDETDSEDGDDELDEGSPRQAREQSEDGDLTDAEEEADDLVGDTTSSAVEPPPQGGPGSGKDAWAAYAAAKGVSIEDGAGRDDIIAEVKKAGHPVD